MPNDMPPDAAADKERQLDAILGAYLEALAAGTTPDRRALLDQHPELAEALKVFFPDYDRVQRLARPLHAVAQAQGETVTEPAAALGEDAIEVGSEATEPQRPGPDLTTDFS